MTAIASASRFLAYRPKTSRWTSAGRTIHVRAIERNGDKEVMHYEELLTLPASVDAEKVGATFRHGLLELTLPYQDAVKPRRIEFATEARKQLSTAA